MRDKGFFRPALVLPPDGTLEDGVGDDDNVGVDDVLDCECLEPGDVDDRDDLEPDRGELHDLAGPLFDQMLRKREREYQVGCR